MPRKKVGIGRKPTQKADDWVTSTEAAEAPPESPPTASPQKPQKPKRLTLDLDPELHLRIKMAAVRDGTTMVDLLRDLLEREFPA